MSIERDRVAIEALRIALKHLGPTPGVVNAVGDIVLTPRGQDIEYIRMALDLYADVKDEHGKRMVTPRQEPEPYGYDPLPG